MATIELTEFVTVEALPICETGVDYPASTGPFSITRSMIQSVIEFTNDDPHGRAPRIKIAHGDSPINADLQSLFEQYQSGRDASVPTLGTIINLATENDGHTLVGDWYGLPAWLAEIMHSAYPARSLEGGSWQNPANQKNYDFMIEAVSLLGIVGPGCTSLADVQELFSKDGPKVTVIEMSRPSKKNGGSLSMPATLQVNVEDIRRDFYDQFAQGDRYYWWDRELLSDPWEFIASDESGDLWRVPFTPSMDGDGDTVIEWGDPQPIKIKYETDPKREGAEDDNAVAATRLVSSRLSGTVGKVLAVNTQPLRKKQTKEAKPAMAIDVPALRTRLGLSETDLPDDATEEQINAALAATPDEETEETTEEPEAGATPPASAEAASGDMVSVHKDVWATTQRGAQLAIEHQRERDRSENDAFLETHIRAGRIPRSTKKSYLAQMNGPNNDGHGPARDALRDMIAKLEKGVAVPIEEIGHSEGETLSSTSQRGTGLFPKLEAARERDAAKEA